MGIYLLDGRSMTEPLEAMARHPAPPFRAAAALAMGHALDEHFVPLLNSMVKDVDAEVRSTALRALLGIRRKASQPPPLPGEPAPTSGVEIKPAASVARVDAGIQQPDTDSDRAEPKSDPQEPGLEDAIEEVPVSDR